VVSRWTIARVSFYTNNFSIIVRKGISRAEGEASVCLDVCPYSTKDGTMCVDDEGGGDCKPYSDLCRLNTLIQEVIAAKNKK